MKLKSVTVEQLALETGKIINEARKRPVIVHTPGKDTLILRMVDDDEVDELLMRSPSFRASIREARRNMAAGKGIPLAEARRRLKA